MACAWAIAEVERIEKKYSRYAETSILSGINRVAGVGGTVAVDEEIADLKRKFECDTPCIEQFRVRKLCEIIEVVRRTR